MEKVTISNLQGESGLVNVVRYFLNNGSEFLIYSLNEVDESGYTRLYVTKLNGVDGNYTAETLNDTEWADIKNLVKVIVKANKEKLPVPVQDINPHKIRNIVLKDKKIFKLNTPLVNDLSANQPNFNEENDTAPTGGEQKTAFDIPSAPTFDTPAQPAFEMPSAPAFDTPAQPTFEMPSAPTFDTPAQPTFEMPSAPTFDTPAQPTFEMPSAPTFDTPAQPTFEMPSAPTFDTPAQPTFDTNNTQNISNFGTFDFGATDTFANPTQSLNNENNQTQSVKELQDEIARLNEEVAKYKSIVDNVKNLIEK